MNYFLSVFLVLGLIENWQVLSNECSDCSEPLVKCEDGKLTGKVMKTREGKNIVAYLGIPFAKPPIGKLRFKVR